MNTRCCRALMDFCKMAQRRSYLHQGAETKLLYVCSVKLYGILKGKNGVLVSSVCYVMQYTIFGLFVLGTNCVLCELRAGEKEQAVALVTETDCLLCDVRPEV